MFNNACQTWLGVDTPVSEGGGGGERERESESERETETDRERAKWALRSQLKKRKT